ncbi:VanZ family protein [Paenibacillus sp. HJL G12]|uniref:VanZ family protein n=1 Tax=Paenibacillus dendrobii TaxID=2691084 RepID=A0A7X3LFA0_9BACL|nr:VanZ family protein [Paenibacillus dendrobii]MWV42817.1 VanZ family protein [Paenibacillus dendrobii]
MDAKQRKWIMIATLLYSVLILYFMFLGFGRIGASHDVDNYTFITIPDEFLKFPKMYDFRHLTLMDWVGLGNLAAFMPFGIMIPLLYGTRFFKFISIFFLSILVLETLQMLTYLGSFDINDAIQNSIGAAAGFAAYKIGFRSNKIFKNLMTTGASAVILAVGVLGLSEMADKAFFNKIESPAQGLNEMEERNGNTSVGTELHDFTIGGEKVVPHINVYTSQGKDFEKYTYALGNKETMISGYYGTKNPKDPKAGATLSWDGNEISLSEVCRPMDNEDNQPCSFEFPLNRVKELTITIEPDAMLWDVTVKRMKYWWN